MATHSFVNVPDVELGAGLLAVMGTSHGPSGGMYERWTP